MTYESVPVRELHEGDVVLHYCMKLKVEHEPIRSTMHPDDHNGCYYASAVVLNPEYVKDADPWLYNMSRAETRWKVQADRLPADDGLHRWQLQGNDLGTYARVATSEEASA